MEVKSTYTFDDEELVNLIMESWVEGFYERRNAEEKLLGSGQPITDDDKRKFAFEKIQSFHWKQTGLLVKQE